MTTDFISYSSQPGGTLKGAGGFMSFFLDSLFADRFHFISHLWNEEIVALRAAVAYHRPGGPAPPAIARIPRNGLP